MERYREAMAALQARGLPHVTDPSNADERYTRNRLRARVLPALQAAALDMSQLLQGQVRRGDGR